MDTAITIDVLVNDGDPDNDPIHVESVDQPENGSVAITADGAVEYTPAADFSGTDTFAYTLADDRGGRADWRARPQRDHRARASAARRATLP